MKNEEKTSVEVIEDINIKVNEILKEQKEFERNILEKLEQKNKIIMQRINKIVENYEILEMQNSPGALSALGSSSLKHGAI